MLVSFGNNSNSTEPYDGSSQLSPTPLYGYVYLAFGVVGTLINATALAIIAGHRVVPDKSSRWHIVNQCICNLIICSQLALKWTVGLSYHVPADLTGDLICTFWDTNRIFWATAMASVLSMQSFTIERYVSVVHPVEHRRFYTSRRVGATIAFCWLFAYVFNSMGMTSSQRAADHCVQRDASYVISRVFGAGIMIVFALMPIPTYLYCHIRMAVEQRKSASTRTGARTGECKERVTCELTSTVIIVGCTFVVFTFPNTFYLPLYLFDVVEVDLTGWPYLLTEGLFNVNFAINSLVYLINIPAFRSALIRVLCCDRLPARRGFPAAASSPGPATVTITVTRF